MDRNLAWHCIREDVSVALRKESVDRNNTRCREIFGHYEVALRKESVDRNVVMLLLLTSLTSVALRKESVDRNQISGSRFPARNGRSPQGERG